MYAAPDKSKPIAIIVPAEPALKKLAQSNGVEGNDLEDLVHNKKLNAIVLKDLQNAGRQGGLKGFEIIDGVVMADEEWNAANVSIILHFLMLGTTADIPPRALPPQRKKSTVVRF